MCIAILMSASSVCAQVKSTRRRTQVSDEARGLTSCCNDRLLKPDFIILRLTYGYAFEKPLAEPQPYTVGDSMNFELFVSQSVFENILVEKSQRAHYEYRPELRRGSEILSYSKEAQKAVEIADHEPPSWTSLPVTLVPGREHQWPTVRLDDWYDRLDPGHYELTVRKRFARDGDWVQSNSVTFEVQQRKSPAPIPAGVLAKWCLKLFRVSQSKKSIN